MRLTAALCLLLLSSPTPGGEANDERQAQKHFKHAGELAADRNFNDAIKQYTAGLKLDPTNATALNQRGAVYFMAAKFKESVADFDAAIKLRPKDANGHWQRGISLYYAGEYEKGKKQFEAYENVSTTDVENATWHFLCAAKKDGVKKAQKGILKIGKDGRIPMMKVYDLYKGTAKPADVLKEATDAKVSNFEKNRALFYAHLYLGLYHDATGDKKKAAEHMKLAATKHKIGHYMWEVARVHHELLSKKK